MTAIEKLRELREKDSSIVAICLENKDDAFYYRDEIPKLNKTHWSNGLLNFGILTEEIDFGTDDLAKCIVTYKDLEEFEVEMMAISKAEYDRLLACEKKLENILNIISK